MISATHSKIDLQPKLLRVLERRRGPAASGPTYQCPSTCALISARDDPSLREQGAAHSFSARTSMNYPLAVRRGELPNPLRDHPLSPTSPPPRGPRRALRSCAPCGTIDDSTVVRVLSKSSSRRSATPTGPQHRRAAQLPRARVCAARLSGRPRLRTLSLASPASAVNIGQPLLLSAVRAGCAPSISSNPSEDLLARSTRTRPA